MVQNVAGNPVGGTSFFDREREIEDIWRRLETDSLLLLAPRRVGKTSVMYRLREDAAERRFVAVYVSVADARNELDFVRKLYERVNQDKRFRRAVDAVTRGPLARVFRRIRKFQFFSAGFELDESAQDQWAHLGEALTREISRGLGASGDRLLFLIDELPIFALTLLRLDPSGARARTFLNWFRQIRLEPELNPRVRWLIAGSIGLDTVARRMRLSDTINDLALFGGLGAFKNETADQLLVALALEYRVPLEPDVRAYVLLRIGWLIPYHLQLFFAELRSIYGDGTQQANKQAVDAVFERLLSPPGRASFDYWEQRLTEELGPPDDRHAVSLLNAVAVNPDGASVAILQRALGQAITEVEARDLKLRYLLDVLESDGYLIRQDDKLRFRSSLLAEFWRRRLSL